MKKHLSILLLSGILMAGAAMPSAAATTATAEEVAYSFQSGDTVIKMNEAAAPVIAALGKEEKYFEADSCAYQGKDKTYTYKGFELSTYPVKGKDYVSSVYFLDGTVATPEGIKIGSTYQDMISAYGKDYKEQNGVYRYTKGNTELSLYTDSKKNITAIEYIAIVK